MAGLGFSVQHSLLLFVLWGAWSQCISLADQAGCRRRLKFIPTVDGQRLDGHVFLNLSIGNYEPCEHRCLMESRCVSVNIGPSIEDDRVVCELNDADQLQHPGDLKDCIGWTYRGTENPCSSNPCFHNARCVNGYSDKGFVCSCPVGYVGEQCEKDINECQEGTHDCHKNATCINTAGHFNCSCNPGHTGDGRNCTVKGFPFHWTLDGSDPLLSVHGGSYQTVDGRKVLFLTGSYSYAETPAIPLQKVSFSILCWINVLSLPDGLSKSVHIYSDWSTPHQFRLYINNRNLKADLRPFIRYGLSGKEIYISQWTHVALTWSREGLVAKLYQNGTQAGTKHITDPARNIDLNPNGHTVYDIGLKRDRGKHETFHGYLRDLIVIDRAITGEEVKDIMARNKP